MFKGERLGEKGQEEFEFSPPKKTQRTITTDVGTEKQSRRTETKCM